MKTSSIYHQQKPQWNWSYLHQLSYRTGAPLCGGFLASFIHWVHRGRDSNRVHLTTSDISWMDDQFDDQRVTTRRPVSLCPNGIYLRKIRQCQGFQGLTFSEPYLAEATSWAYDMAKSLPLTVSDKWLTQYFKRKSKRKSMEKHRCLPNKYIMK